MKRILMPVLAAMALATGMDARAQDMNRQIHLSDGSLMSWGTATMGSGGGALVKFGTPYKNPPVVVVTANAGAKLPSAAAPFAAVVWKVYPQSFTIKSDTPGIVVNYMAFGM